MPGPVVTDDYVACCLCTGVFRANGGGLLPYLPIPRTLYCTWGSWAGNLIWQNPSLPSWFTGGACVYFPNSWSGVATIPFRYRVEGSYGYCDPTIFDTTAECVVNFNCFGYAGAAVRARPCAGTYGCMELNETLGTCFGVSGAYCRIPNVCYGCDGEFSATLTTEPSWVDVPPTSDQPWYLWCHNVSDLQTSSCYISE
jgi:hypothetical protein